MKPSELFHKGWSWLARFEKEPMKHVEFGHPEWADSIQLQIDRNIQVAEEVWGEPVTEAAVIWAAGVFLTEGRRRLRRAHRLFLQQGINEESMKLMSDVYVTMQLLSEVIWTEGGRRAGNEVRDAVERVVSEFDAIGNDWTPTTPKIAPSHFTWKCRKAFVAAQGMIPWWLS